MTVSDSTKRRYITMVTAEDERFLVKDGVVLINKDQVLEQVSIILKELQVASNDMSKAALEEKDAKKVVIQRGKVVSETEWETAPILYYKECK